MKFDAQPPHANDTFDSVVGWEWASRITQAVRDFQATTISLTEIVNPPIISFSDDVPLLMSNTTLASLIYRHATNDIGLVNGAVDLMTVDVTTKLATFAAGGVFGGSLTVLAGGATITGGLTVTSGGANVTGAIVGSSSITAKNDIVSQQGNVTVKDTQGVIFNNNAGNSVFIRHNSGGLEFVNASGISLKLFDSSGIQITARTSLGASAGGASPLPSQPDQYMTITVTGLGVYKVPLYLP
jgi:hypothetical protein